jgi:hypothetical protein
MAVTRHFSFDWVPTSCVAIVVASLFFFSSTPIGAEIVIDDFDDPAQIVVPGMQGQFVETENVGDFGALRIMRIFALQGNPSGYLDSGISTPSILTSQITRLGPIPFGETLASVQTDYEFQSVDFSQRGLNNAFFFEFAQLTSRLAPSIFSILFRDANDFFLYFESPFILKDQPFTVVAPFDRFTFRDGQPGIPDYTKIESLSISLRISEIAGGGPDPLNFFMQLDRIRIGRIPEPNCFALFVSGLLVLGIAPYQQFIYGGRNCDSPVLSDSGGDRIMVLAGGPKDERVIAGSVASSATV